MFQVNPFLTKWKIRITEWETQEQRPNYYHNGDKDLAESSTMHLKYHELMRYGKTGVEEKAGETDTLPKGGKVRKHGRETQAIQDHL